MSTASSSPARIPVHSSTATLPGRSRGSTAVRLRKLADQTT
jgi:hypothetical protein